MMGEVERAAVVPPMHDVRPDPVVSFDYEEQARTLLPAHVAAYIGAAAGSGGGSAEGIADWSAVRFRPRALQDLRTIDTRTTAQKQSAFDTLYWQMRKMPEPERIELLLLRFVKH